jgi:glycine cleavage system transcriptional repressor
MAQAVISTIGQDRPGIVNALAERVSALGVNIDDSRMAVLGGEFAVLMAVTGSPESLAALDSALSQYANDAGFAYLFRPTENRPAALSLPATVNVVAMDHPGIVHGVARFFSGRDINIRDLDTESVPAAHTGTPIFNLTMTIEVPPGVRMGQLRAEFEAFCDEEGLDGAVVAG